MRLFKIISVSLAAVTAAGISTAAFAAETEGSGIAATSGEKGVVTYTFTEDITSVGTHTSSDGALVVNIRTTDENTAHVTNFSDGSLNLGRSAKSGGSTKDFSVSRAPEKAGDYIVYTAYTDGVLTGELNAISWFKNINEELNSCEFYNYGDSSKFSMEVAKGDVIELGARENSSSISSITFTPDTYDESYTFDIEADELADKTLSVTYGSDTKEKLLSDLIATQTNGEGNVMLTGIRFTDIPKDVAISSVVIK